MKTAFLQRHQIKPNEHEVTSALITNDGAPSGTYIINVEVKYDNNVQYGDQVYKIYVTVP